MIEWKETNNPSAIPVVWVSILVWLQKVIILNCNGHSVKGWEAELLDSWNLIGGNWWPYHNMWQSHNNIMWECQSSVEYSPHIQPIISKRQAVGTPLIGLQSIYQISLWAAVGCLCPVDWLWNLSCSVSILEELNFASSSHLFFTTIHQSDILLIYIHIRVFVGRFVSLWYINLDHGGWIGFNSPEVRGQKHTFDPEVWFSNADSSAISQLQPLEK